MKKSFLVSALMVVLMPFQGFAQEKTDVAKAVKERDGQHDFDWEIGTWKTHLKRRLRPLTGSNEWVEMEGITTCRKVMNGRANLIELVADGTKGTTAHFEGVSLRLYNPEARQWTLNFANMADGMLVKAQTGEFKNGRGEFWAEENLRGRIIFVKFVITQVDPNTWQFEQSFSEDGGKSWEVNWLATDTRIEEPKAK